MKLDADIHLVVERSLRLVACSLVLKAVIEPTEQQETTKNSIKSK
jgi:hypothetical protein